MIRPAFVASFGLALLMSPPLAAQTLGIACFDEDEQGRRSNYEAIAIGAPIVIDLTENETVLLQEGTRIELDTALAARVQIDPVDPGDDAGYRISGTLSCMSADGGFSELTLDHTIKPDGSLHLQKNGWRAAITITGLPPSM